MNFFNFQASISLKNLVLSGRNLFNFVYPNTLHRQTLKLIFPRIFQGRRIINYISPFIPAISTLLGALFLFTGIIRASASLHAFALSNVMHWSAQIFDTTPVGRIINRFGYDIDVLDSRIGHNFRQIFQNLALVC